jgi:hypothetical protein
MMNMLTYETALKYLKYDPETGNFHYAGNKYCNKPKGSIAGSLHKTKGYIYVSIAGKTYRAQRIAFLLMTGRHPKFQIDHINGVKTDNRWCNLRDISSQGNCANRGLFKNNKSGYRGVVWQKYSKKWQVLCRIKGVQYYLGLYEDKEEAAKVAKETYEKYQIETFDKF